MNAESQLKPALFHLRNSHIGYGKSTLLNDISLSICAGEKVAIIGRSGAGKTTLLRHLYEQQQSTTAWCPQALGLVANLSVFLNVYMGRLDKHNWLYNLANLLHPMAQERAAMIPLINDVGLAEKLNCAVESLSGGQQQRTAIARALHQNTDIFMGDEPVSSLDPYQGEDLLGLICARHDTVIIALHDVELARRHFDRIIALGNSGIMIDRPANQLDDVALQPIYAAAI